MYDLEEMIRARHSSRKYLSTPVPRNLLDESLALATSLPQWRFPGRTWRLE